MEVWWMDTPEDWTMFFIMCYCAAGTIVFLMATIMAVVSGYLSARTLTTTQKVLTDNVRPALENVRETTSTVRGTAAFMSEKAVTPVVKAYATYAGARQFMTVLARLARRQGG
jgi:hypothetical protein